MVQTLTTPGCFDHGDFDLFRGSYGFEDAFGGRRVGVRYPLALGYGRDVPGEARPLFASILTPCVWIDWTACGRGKLLPLDHGLLLYPLRLPLVVSDQLAKVFADRCVSIARSPVLDVPVHRFRY
jgi:hypothetical protein